MATKNNLDKKSGSRARPVVMTAAMIAALSLALTALCAASLWAQPQREAREEDTSTQYFSSWNVAVVGVQTDDFSELSQGAQRAALFVSALLEAGVKGVPKHFLNPQELAKGREIVREAAILSLQKKLDAARIKLDTESFADETKEIAFARFKAQKEIKQIQKDLRAIRNLKNEDVPVGASLPVSAVLQPDREALAPTEDLRALSQRIGAQSLFYFRLGALQDGYLILSVYEYNDLTQKETRLAETVVNQSRVSSLQEMLSRLVREHVTGKPVASLRVEAKINSDEEPWIQRARDAAILIDGVPSGAGSVSLDVIPAGRHSIIVEFQGQQRSMEIELKPNEAAMREVFFDIDAKNTITLLSLPTQADVYVNSLWAGTTPLVLSRPYGNIADQVELRLRGHETSRQTINMLSPQAITVQLVPTFEEPLDARLKKSRNRFYIAFSIFAASLVAPIVLNGLYASESAALTVAQQDARVSPAAFAASRSRRDAYLYSYIATAVLSGGLSIYATVELFRYLKTASEYHDR